MARRRKTADPTRVVAYLRVSTDEQADSGAGLAAQRRAIRDEVERRGWSLVATHTDAGLSGKTMERPGLQAALADVRDGHAGTLMVAKLDRLSRSLVDFAGVMADATERRWNLVALDLGIDLSTPAGEFMASVMAAAAAWERRIIGQRTKDALAAKRAAGVRLGRPATVSDAAAHRIIELRSDGLTWQGVADAMTAERWPTGQGAERWAANTCRRIAEREVAA